MVTRAPFTVVGTTPVISLSKSCSRASSSWSLNQRAGSVVAAGQALAGASDVVVPASRATTLSLGGALSTTENAASAAGSASGAAGTSPASSWGGSTAGSPLPQALPAI